MSSRSEMTATFLNRVVATQYDGYGIFTRCDGYGLNVWTDKDKNSHYFTRQSEKTILTKGDEESQIEESSGIPPELDRKRLGVLGKDPPISNAGEEKLHLDLVTRWSFRLKDMKEELLKKYP